MWLHLAAQLFEIGNLQASCDALTAQRERDCEGIDEKLLQVSSLHSNSRPSVMWGLGGCTYRGCAHAQSRGGTEPA